MSAEPLHGNRVRVAGWTQLLGLISTALLAAACGASHTREGPDTGQGSDGSAVDSGGHAWADDCVARRGCTSPAPPPCDAASEAGRSVEDVLASHEGSVLVEGFLSRAGNVCTRLRCSEGQCCNRCEGGLVVTTEPRPFLAWPQPPFVAISAGEASHCVGDDSGQCCGLRVGGPVRVEGTVVSDPTYVGGLRLDATRLCQP